MSEHDNGAEGARILPFPIPGMDENSELGEMVGRELLKFQKESIGLYLLLMHMLYKDPRIKRKDQSVSCLLYFAENLEIPPLSEEAYHLAIKAMERQGEGPYVEEIPLLRSELGDNRVVQFCACIQHFVNNVEDRQITRCYFGALLMMRRLCRRG